MIRWQTHWGVLIFIIRKYVNRMHGRSGHLWQNRFYSCPLDSVHRGKAFVYIERNPVRAKMVKQAWDYEWSSASAHVGGKDPSGLLDIESWTENHSTEEWRRRLVSREDQEFIASIRGRTNRCRPLGSDKFISTLETLVGRRLRALPVGRPRMKAK